MPLIYPKGNPASDVWVIIDRPLPGDKDKGYVYSSGLGYLWDGMMKEADIDSYYVAAWRPDTEVWSGGVNITAELNHYQPRIIIPLDAVGTKLVPEMQRVRKTKNYNPDTDSEIAKYAGSILTSNDLKYPHYIVPTFPPELVARQYKLRDQVILDLAKAKSELDYAKQHGILEPLPARTLKYEFESIDEEIYLIDSFCKYPIVSNDIETIYPKAPTKKSPSQFYGKHPGYPITVGLAPTKDFGISIDLFREDTRQTIKLWKALDNLFRTTPQLGQNFFNFDLNFYESLGFRFRVGEIQDTMVRHHLLYPELPHKLQHLTRQYTREPYYKDEGHGWSMKDKRKLKMYNCKDVCVTMEVWECQEQEFAERPHLR